MQRPFERKLVPLRIVRLKVTSASTSALEQAVGMIVARIECGLHRAEPAWCDPGEEWTVCGGGKGGPSGVGWRTRPQSAGGAAGFAEGGAVLAEQFTFTRLCNRNQCAAWQRIDLAVITPRLVASGRGRIH